jgi:ArsR family transcriptional regulator, arsenate/arsenite/antimonite-responsive transcriptional repressor
MEINEVASCLEALGNPVRLQVFRTLVRGGPDGLNFGQLQERIGIPRSTLAHHLNNMVQAGVLTQQRDGREVFTRVDFARLQQALSFVMGECCQDGGST